MARVFLSLGSNIGDRASNLSRALSLLRSDTVRIRRVSSLYESSPVGVTDEPVPDYINCVAEADTGLPPRSLLDYVKGVESRMGRAPTFRWGPRVIDIDILLYEGVTVESDELTIPHPRIADRKFVLIPLLELEPEFVFPDGRRLKELAASDRLLGQSLNRLQNERMPAGTEIPSFG